MLELNLFDVDPGSEPKWHDTLATFLSAERAAAGPRPPPRDHRDAIWDGDEDIEVLLIVLEFVCVYVCVGVRVSVSTSTSA